MVADALAKDFEVEEPQTFRITDTSFKGHPLPRLTALQLGVLPGLIHAPPLLDAVSGGCAARLVKKLVSNYLLFPSEERRRANEGVIGALKAVRSSLPPKALSTDPVRINAILYQPSHVTPELLKLVRASLSIFQRFASGS